LPGPGPGAAGEGRARHSRSIWTLFAERGTDGRGVQPPGTSVPVMPADCRALVTDVGRRRDRHAIFLMHPVSTAAREQVELIPQANRLPWLQTARSRRSPTQAPQLKYVGWK
jgi:hypothetical protein